MTLKARIHDDMKAAMRAKDSVRLDAIRMLRAAIQRREVDDRTELDENGVLTVIQKLVKQSEDAVGQFQAGDRPDLVEKEQRHIDLLRTYLPEPLSEAEIDALVRDAIGETGASSMRDMGKVMGALKSKLQGHVDMGQVSAKVKAMLQG